LTQRINDATEELLLTRKQVAAQMGVTDAKIRPYAEAAPDFFGAVDARGKGVRYPAQAVERFQQALRMTPGVFREQIAAKGSSSINDANNEALTQRRNDAVSTFDNGSMDRLIDALMANATATRALPPPADRLLTPDDAADLLQVSPSTVRRLIKPVKIGRLVRYRESDIHRFIASAE